MQRVSVTCFLFVNNMINQKIKPIPKVQKAKRIQNSQDDGLRVLVTASETMAISVLPHFGQVIIIILPNYVIMQL